MGVWVDQPFVVPISWFIDSYLPPCDVNWRVISSLLFFKEGHGMVAAPVYGAVHAPPPIGFSFRCIASSIYVRLQ